MHPAYALRVSRLLTDLPFQPQVWRPAVPLELTFPPAAGSSDAHVHVSKENQHRQSLAQFLEPFAREPSPPEYLTLHQSAHEICRCAMQMSRSLDLHAALQLVRFEFEFADQYTGQALKAMQKIRAAAADDSENACSCKRATSGQLRCGPASQCTNRALQTECPCT